MSDAPSAVRTPVPPLGLRVVQNVAALLGGRITGILLAMVTSILLVRHLGSEQLGLYGAVYAYTTLFAWLAAFGLEPILTREASRRTGERADLMATGVWLAARCAFVALVVALLVAPLAGYSGMLHVLVVLAGVELLLLVPLRLREVMFRVEMKQWYVVGIGLLRQVAWLALLAGLVVAGAPLVLVVSGRLLCAVGESLLIWRASRKLLPARGRVLSGEVRFLLKQSLPVAIGVLAWGIYHRIDQVMLHNMLGARDLGHYVAGVNLVEPLQMMPFALLGALFPVLSQSVADPARMQRYLDMSFRLLAVTSFTACVVFTLAGAPLLVMLYGAEFRASAPVLIILVWAQPVIFMANAISNVNMARNHQVLNLVANGGGAVMNVGLNLVFIPLWGITGAAWATLASYLFGCVLLWLIPARTRPLVLHGLRSFVPGAGVALAAVGAMHLLGWSWWLAVPAGSALLALGLWGLGVVRREDVQWTLGVLRPATKPEATA